ncbi:MAG: SUMF1/EgtB/PvdO family nonheme iron enzyme, partial [Planctomycetes bacterium]|nr:SUMF1/EgtB/PvdO family nonheme iron enzyme [Planctomycetota bacterium]
PVTVQQHSEFLAAYAATALVVRAQWWPAPTPDRQKLTIAEWKGWLGESDEWGPQQAYPNRPVTLVSWYEAMAYCRWRTQQDRDGREYRLPTSAEWQWAAEGKQLRYYPWGAEGKAPGHGGAARANWHGAGVGHPSPVGAFPAGGCGGMVDLAGNVEELCSNEVGDAIEACRGGSWALREPEFLRCRSRCLDDPRARVGRLGFRVLRDV